MALTLMRRIRTVVRFVVPTRSQRFYARALRQSGLFDQAFYRTANPRLRALFRLAPERHYVLFGEALGLSPNPHFAPRAYLFHNPDLAGSGVAPMLHYIESGWAQRRRVRYPPDQRGHAGGAMPEIDAGPAPCAPVAVLLHLFYQEMWGEFADALQRQSIEFDLFVTITGPDAEIAGLKQRILRRFPRARVWSLPNHGRDIFPFVHLVNSGVLDPYRAICKLHSKKSPHRGDGDNWRRALTAGVLGEAAWTAHQLKGFLDDKRAGIWVAPGQICRGGQWWGPNRPRAEALLARVGASTKDRALCFAAGSIYWIKPALIHAIRALKLTAQDFEPEQALVDGTTAHAMERVLGYLATNNGLDLREAPDPAPTPALPQPA